jgi:hypothetical protein
MNMTIAAQMIGAELLRLRRKRWLVAVSLFFTLGILAIVYAVTVIQHASNPGRYGPAGGVHNFNDTINFLFVFFGSLAMILIGTEAGAGDQASGVFRDLVATGRSRLALFAVRVPAALILSLTIVLIAYVTAVAGTFVFAGNLPTPSTSLVIESGLFVLLANGFICIVAVGFASLTGSRPATLVTLIGWVLIASRLIVSISSLGRFRDIVPEAALSQLKPGRALRDVPFTMSVELATAVLVVWIVLWTALGAWRTRTVDA